MAESLRFGGVAVRVGLVQADGHPDGPHNYPYRQKQNNPLNMYPPFVLRGVARPRGQSLR